MKPIHKFNNGNGATLCNTCDTIISTGMTGKLWCGKHFNCNRVKREGEGCPLNDNCKYPECNTKNKGVRISDELAELTEDLIWRAEFNAGADQEERFDNSVYVANAIHAYANQKVIEELEDLLTCAPEYRDMHINNRIKKLKTWEI